MNESAGNQFNEQLRERTLKMAASIRNMLVKLEVIAIDRAPIQQLIRSASSVAANYRSATRGRSDAEYYSKICIVVEEVDETLFWLEYLIEVNLLNKEENMTLLDEVTQMVRLFSTIKRKMREKIESTAGRKIGRDKT